MPIKGIDTEKCTNCQQCLRDCPATNFRLDENKQVQFNPFGCIGCGHCIAVCPEEAILYSGMGEDPISFEDFNPSSLITYEAFQKFIRAKRSIRQFKNKKIPNGFIAKIMDSMKYAPTGSNVRGLRCNIISNTKQIRILSEAIVDDLVGSQIVPENYSKMLDYKRKKGLDPIFYGASHVMIFHSRNSMDLMNSTIAITYGMLTAQTLGLGTCWIALAEMALRSNKEIRKDIAKINGRVHGVFILGYPSVKYARSAPRPKIRVKELK